MNRRKAKAIRPGRVGGADERAVAVAVARGSARCQGRKATRRDLPHFPCAWNPCANERPNRPLINVAAALPGLAAFFLVGCCVSVATSGVLAQASLPRVDPFPSGSSNAGVRAPFMERRGRDPPMSWGLDSYHGPKKLEGGADECGGDSSIHAAEESDAVIGAIDCDAPDCKVELQGRHGTTHKFDLSPICRQAKYKDFQQVDSNGHKYHLQVCGHQYAIQECNPRWHMAKKLGMVVQMWGAVPRGPKTCTDPLDPSRPVCCTQDCEVLAGSNITWSAALSANPRKGGLLGTFPPLPRAADNPFPCPYPHLDASRVRYLIRCDDRLQSTYFRNVIVDSNDTCDYTLVFDSPNACAVVTLSWGWYFILLLMVILSLYVLVGMLWNFCTKQTCEYPNTELWSKLAVNVEEGVMTLVKLAGLVTAPSPSNVQGDSARVPLRNTPPT